MAHAALSRIRGRDRGSVALGVLAFVVALAVVMANHVSFFVNSASENTDHRAAVLPVPVMPASYATVEQLATPLRDAARAVTAAKSRRCVEPCPTVRAAVAATTDTLDRLTAQNGASRRYDAEMTAYSSSVASARADTLASVADALGISSRALRTALGVATACALELGAIAFWYISAPTVTAPATDTAPVPVTVTATVKTSGTAPTAAELFTGPRFTGPLHLEPKREARRAPMPPPPKPRVAPSAPPPSVPPAPTMPEPDVCRESAGSASRDMDADVTRVIAAIDAGELSVGVRRIRPFLGCNQEHASEVNRIAREKLAQRLTQGD
ncbi:hypothetical protein AB4Y36_10125 [Paraburkholderia sp. BR10936]|uniref:hypothetical protein n=1 Tax=Paraburkholderia sp. BR10936 TaxID=3236993 RepID=UPI0034D319B6